MSHRKRNAALDHNTENVLVLVSPSDDFSQTFVPNVLLPRILHLYHHLLSERHAGERCMYDTMHLDFCWPYVANYVYATEKDCLFVYPKPSNESQSNQASINFSSSIIAVCGCGHIWFIGKNTGNQFIGLVTDWYSELSKKFPTI